MPIVKYLHWSLVELSKRVATMDSPWRDRHRCILIEEHRTNDRLESLIVINTFLFPRSLFRFRYVLSNPIIMVPEVAGQRRSKQLVACFAFFPIPIPFSIRPIQTPVMS